MGTFIQVLGSEMRNVITEKCEVAGDLNRQSPAHWANARTTGENFRIHTEDFCKTQFDFDETTRAVAKQMSLFNHKWEMTCYLSVGHFSLNGAHVNPTHPYYRLLLRTPPGSNSVINLMFRHLEKKIKMTHREMYCDCVRSFTKCVSHFRNLYVFSKEYM